MALIIPLISLPLLPIKMKNRLSLGNYVCKTQSVEQKATPHTGHDPQKMN